MRLPNADRAVIEPAKLHAYLLSRTHPLGRLKAAFFFGLGCSSEDWRRLAADLRSQHLTRDATPRESSRYGKKWEIRAPLEGPSGNLADVVSVWVVLANEDFPRFVTAYPGGGR
ncbi:MAG: DUF6883 domain-containing protein [Candidatus Methylomirabilales bacterium]